MLLPTLFILLLSLAHAFQTTHFEHNFGAEIHGINIRTLTSQDKDDIQSLLLRYKFLVLRGQSGIGPDELRSFTLHFGPLHVHLESSSHYPGYEDVNVVSNIVNQSTGKYIGLFGGHVENFHSDLSWDDLPTKITIVTPSIRPSDCGHTIFADSTRAFEDLSLSLKALLAGKQGRYCYLKHRVLEPVDGEKVGTTDLGLSREEVLRASACASHPIFNTHPETGKHNIFVNPSHTKSIVGEDGEDWSNSTEILAELFAHVSDPRHIYSHHWQEGDVVMWDNRAMQHRATPCPASSPRMLIRTTIASSEAPIEIPFIESQFPFISEL